MEGACASLFLSWQWGLERASDRTTAAGEAGAATPERWYAAAAPSDIPSEAAAPDAWEAGRTADAKARLAEQALQPPSRAEALARRHWLTRPGSYWDQFYAANTDAFFRDRHYLGAEFRTPLALGLPAAPAPAGGLWVLDFGCGVGNAAVPLLKSHPGVRVAAFDISRRAVDILASRKRDALAGGQEWATRLVGPVAHDCTDVEATGAACSPGDGSGGVQGSLPSIASPLSAPAGARKRGGFDACLLIFVLSAVPPGVPQMRCLTAARRALRPGGRILFRDYAAMDEAQLRFHGSRRIDTLPAAASAAVPAAGGGGGGVGAGSRLYARGDGTLSYFFEPAELIRLAAAAGLEVLEMRPLLRKVRNRATGAEVRRVWLQAVLQRPADGAQLLASR
mmetsp:Transcript_904/g.3494  ORF Transcript_904/g.3494 Transcript_904/m.3494 type:complete len:394 (-) Transcript_904:154-1335(-)